jgi:hypothetical protein
MPLQNRVTPDGEIITTPARGLMYGNRGGSFHYDDRTLKSRHWASKQWICCVLEFKGRRRPLMRPGRFTELFFLDEATAFAAGHRPCFECRRADATRFAELWSEVHGGKGRASAPAMDEVLHRERCSAPDYCTASMPVASLPDGVFVRVNGKLAVVLGDSFLTWTPDGYAETLNRPTSGNTDVITPPSTVAVIHAGYRPALHPSSDQ